MLESELILKAPCKAGANLLDMQQVGNKKVQTATGQRLEPRFEYLYVVGSSLGALTDVRAPLDLLPGDVVMIEPGDGLPLRVVRNGADVWEHGAAEEKPVKAKAKA